MRQVAKERWQFVFATVLAVLDLMAAIRWRMVSIERFGSAIDYIADYSGPSPEEQFRSAYVVLAAAGLVALISVVKLRRHKHLQWCLPLVLAFVSITIILLPH